MADRDNGEETGSKRPLDGGGDFGNAKRPRASRHSSGSGSGNRVELRLLIPISGAGAIIGKGGSNIRDMREQFNASIQIPDSQGVERVVNATAFNPDDLSRLCGKIVSCLQSEWGNTKNQEIRILVHKSQAGTIIGVRGFKIKELRETTGAAIKVFQDCCPHSTDRICQVRGTNETIIEAVKAIINLLETAPPKGPVQRYDPNNFDESYEYGGFTDEGEYGGGRQGNYGGPRSGQGMFQGGPHGGQGFMGRRRMGGRGNFGNVGRGGFRGQRGGDSFYGGQGNDYGPDPNFGGAQGGYGNYGPMSEQSQGVGFPHSGSGRGGQETSTKVTIPTSLAGSIIGKGGQRIRQIRQDCGAQIKIDEPAPGSNDRVITITGTQEQIQNAQFLLQRSVKLYSGDKF